MPSTRLLQCASFHPRWSLLAMEFAVIVGQGHSQDNAGWSCACIRNHGNNGYRWGREGHRRLTNGWAHHPTANRQFKIQEWTAYFWDLLFRSRSPRFYPSYQRTPHTPCSGTNPNGQSRSCSRNGTYYISRLPWLRGQLL